MIELNERLEVASPPEQVWAILSDPRTVVTCVPGAELGDQKDDGSYDSRLTVRFGPTRVTFRATVSLTLDEASRTGSVQAHGRDTLGGTRMATKAGFDVAAAPAGSLVEIKGNVDITGPLAGLIEGGAKAVVQRMSAEFAANLATRLSS
ncbi:MAG: SRPBCC family protein [Chloroflexi bacterium]|nr:SRPBCC family protein [Chloroflexota bacterium]